jgi:hypothetical protein
MAKTNRWIAKACALGLLVTASFMSSAWAQDSKISIDRALNSPTLTVRYSGAHAALIELRVNGTSFGTRNADPGNSKGETNFTLDLTALSNGDNEVEVRLYDKNGKLLGVEKSNVSTDDGSKSPVYLIVPKMGSTVQGPVQIDVGFGKDLHNTYVSFFIDNQFKSMTNTPPFNFMWDTTHDANGWHEVEAWVVDDMSVTYKTRRVKVYVNNPGGNTARHFNATEPINITPAAPKVAAPVAKIPIAPKAVPAAALPVPKAAPKLNLQPISSPASAPLGAIAGAKAANVAGVTTTLRAATAMTPKVAATVPLSNEVRPELGAAASVKASTYSPAYATGPQILMPTGHRMALPKPVAIAAKVVVPLAKPMAAKGLPALPKPVALTGVIGALPPKVAAVKPRVRLTPLPKEVAAKPAIVAAQKPVAIANFKPAPLKISTLPQTRAVSDVASASFIRVTHGSKLPHVGAYSILMDSKVVNFDVAPRVQNGVPLTPFRHLFEQSGGKVGWEHASKTVLANGHGREIYIKIGNKLAKVNNLPIEMDLAPFIENGRTVVPLSFLKDSLDIEIDYDPVTGHVLITSIKKKQ